MSMTPDDRDQQAKGVSRRGFLTGVGAGAAGAAAGAATGGLLNPHAAHADHLDPRTRPDRFSRLFNNLPSFAEPSSSMIRALRTLGEPGGMLDARDPLAEGPVRLITNPELSPRNRDNNAGQHTAGTTFLGQFLDHDMTFDTTSRLAVVTDPLRSPNTRTPSLDLDSVYGGGPAGSPQLYQSRDRIKFRVEDNGQFEDLPRNSNGSAIIADPRNDENMMIQGLQVMFLIAHNKLVDILRRQNPRDSDGEVFRDARQILTWHYQWIIVHEFLPQIIGQSVVNDILNRGRRFYTPRPGEQSIPVEFQGAVYRFGHSMVRPSYRANLNGDNDAAFFGFIFDPAGEGQPDPVDLRGGARAPRRFIGWQTFFNFGNVERPRPVGGTMGPLSQDVRPNKIIDTNITTALFNLPLGAIASGDQPTSLPQRNLLRHLTWSIPSGQAIAQAMRAPVLGSSHFQDLARLGVGLDRRTPLWVYILREAAVQTNGLTLGAVGGRIVGEVFIGLLRLDPDSYLSENPRWRPTIRSATPGTFKMIDLLTFADLDPTSRGQ
jgi:hypothetical protein